MSNNRFKTIIRNILSDIRVELGDEFDRNFERQAYFNEAWERHRSPLRQGDTLLIDSGALRGSVQSRTTEDSITFYTNLPYAAIHNEGGEIVVTERMKRYFWRKSYEASGGFGRTKSGALRNNKRNRRLTTEAEFYKAMALKKVGTTIKIPRRQFLGTGPEVERIVCGIVEDCLNDYFDANFSIEKK